MTVLIVITEAIVIFVMIAAVLSNKVVLTLLQTVKLWKFITEDIRKYVSRK